MKVLSRKIFLGRNEALLHLRELQPQADKNLAPAAILANFTKIIHFPRERIFCAAAPIGNAGECNYCNRCNSIEFLQFSFSSKFHLFFSRAPTVLSARYIMYKNIFILYRLSNNNFASICLQINVNT